MNSSVSILGDEHSLKCELAGETLRSSGSLRLRVTGWSMLPTIWPGDTLVVEQVRGDDVIDGAIVIFGNGRRLVAHRVIAKSGPGHSVLRTQGDAVPHPDVPVSGCDLIGRVSFILRKGKRLTPRRRLRLCERAVAAVFRRCEIAARVVARLHRMRRNSQVQMSGVQA